MSTDRRNRANGALSPGPQARNSRAFHRAQKQLPDLRRNLQSKYNQTDLIPNMNTSCNPQSKNNQSDLVPYSDTTSEQKARQRVLVRLLQHASPNREGQPAARRPHDRIVSWTRSDRCFQIPISPPSREISGLGRSILAAFQYRRVSSRLNPAFRFWFIPNFRLRLRKRTFSLCTDWRARATRGTPGAFRKRRWSAAMRPIASTCEVAAGRKPFAEGRYITPAKPAICWPLLV